MEVWEVMYDINYWTDSWLQGDDGDKPDVVDIEDAVPDAHKDIELDKTR